MSATVEARRHEGHQTQVFIKADVFSMDLGHLRALVSAAEGMPDKASVTFENLSKSYTHVDEWEAKACTVRHWEVSR